VNFEGAGRKCHQQGNVVAEISKLACVRGRTLCGKVSWLDNVINVAKCVGGVVVLSLQSLPVAWQWVQGLMLFSVQGERHTSQHRVTLLVHVSPLQAPPIPLFL